MLHSLSVATFRATFGEIPLGIAQKLRHETVAAFLTQLLAL